MQKVTKTEDEWRAELSPEAFRVLRGHGTERAGTHDDFPKAPGRFVCRGCGTPVFGADTKFESGTGWPSFWSKWGDGSTVEEQEDRSFFMRRTEVHCAACDGHLGHVFPDGPPPTGLRYCINGAALRFEPEDGGEAA